MPTIINLATDALLKYSRKNRLLGLFAILFLTATNLYSAGVVVFSDNMDSAPTGWTMTQTPESNNSILQELATYNSAPASMKVNRGTACTWLWAETNINLTGYDDAKMSVYLRQLHSVPYFNIDYFNGSWVSVYTSDTNNKPWIKYGDYSIPVNSTKIRLAFFLWEGVGGYYFDDVVVTGDKRPALSWTGEASYTTDGVNPDSGMPSDSFTYRIKYTDADNDAPTYVRVHILKGGTEISGSPFAMSYVSGSHDSGSIYTYSRTLADGNDYTYYFDASDGWLAANNTSTLAGPIVILPDISGYVKYPDSTGMPGVLVSLSGTESRNTYTDNSGFYQFVDLTFNGNYNVTTSSYSYYSFNPSTRTYTVFQADQTNQDFIRINSTSTASLVWTGETNYTNSGIFPHLGSPNTWMYYRIKYTDPENDSPKAGDPKLNILKTGSPIAGSPFLMTEVDSGDENYIDGKLYEYNIKLSTGLDYSYYFNTYDIWTTSSVAPTTQLKPDIAINPIISWLESDTYNDKAVYPDYAVFGSTFVYNIVYADPDNYAPKSGYPKLHVLKNGGEITGSPFQMSYLSGNHNTGSIWTYEKFISSAGFDFSYLIETYNIFDAQSNNLTGNGPSIPTYIKGYVKDSKGDGIENVSLSLSGYDTSSYTTGNDGSFVFLITTNSYTLTPTAPTSLMIDRFEPSLINLSETETNIDNLLITAYSKPPEIPSNISPKAVDGGSVVSKRVVLSWGALSYSGSLTYNLYVSEPQNSVMRHNAVSLVPTLGVVYSGPNTSYTLTDLIAGQSYDWQVKAVDTYGVSSLSPIYSFKTFDMAATKVFSYPNPFNPNTTNTNIVFKSETQQDVKIKIYSEYGDLVFETVFPVNPGTNEYAYNGKDNSDNILFNGSYIVRIIKNEGESKCYIAIVK